MYIIEMYKTGNFSSGRIYYLIFKRKKAYRIANGLKSAYFDAWFIYVCLFHKKAFG